METITVSMEEYNKSIKENINRAYLITDDPLNKTLTIAKPLDFSYALDSTLPYKRDIIYIHKTNCPNCGGLLDGNEYNPYVKCSCCGAKIWAEREIT